MEIKVLEAKIQLLFFNTITSKFPGQRMIQESLL